MAIKVVSSVRGTPEYGPNSPLYVAMGYIPDKEKKVGRPKKSEQSTTKKTFQDPELEEALGALQEPPGSLPGIT